MLDIRRTPSQTIVFLGTAHDNGGSSILAHNLAQAMRRAGHTVEEWYLFGSRHPAPGTRVFREGPRSAAALVTLMPAVIRALRRRSPDVVIGLQPLSNLLVGMTGVAAGVPCRIATLHNPRSQFNAALMFLDRVLGNAGGYTSIVACARNVADTYRGNGAGYVRRLHVIVNGQVKPRRWARAAARDRLGLAPDAFVVGQIGRIGHQKNQDFTRDLLARLPEATGLFVGSGPEQEAFARTLDAHGLGARTRLVPAMPPEEIGAFFAASDVVVFPSRYEGLSLAAIEAVHCGTPLVCSDIPPFRELFAPSPVAARALLLPLDRPAAWAERLNALRHDGDFRQTILVELAQLSPKYDFDSMASHYLDLVSAPGLAVP